MIPSNQQVDVVAALIVRTQRAELLWERVRLQEGAIDDGVWLGAWRGEYYRVSSDGLTFRLYKQDGVQQRGFRGINQGVVLEITDQDDEARKEVICEIDDVPILRNLYDIASGQSKPLLKKLDQFVRKAG